MAALTANREVDHYLDQELRTFKIAAAKNIFKGSFVGLDSSGFAQPLVAGNKFLGVAYSQGDNSSGSDGDVLVKVFTLGDFELALSGAVQADIGKAAFASDDGTLTKTSTSNSYVGMIQDVPASGTVIVRIGDVRGKQPALTAEDASVVDGTYGTEEQDVINNTRTRVGELEQALQNVGIQL